jgi:hypothetical protein
MAKRRNLKKEKALRNQAYARKFRKRSNSRYGRRFFNSNRGDGAAEDKQDEETTAAAD